METQRSEKSAYTFINQRVFVRRSYEYLKVFNLTGTTQTNKQTHTHINIYIYTYIYQNDYDILAN
jgi:hypothetical protein